MQDNIKNYYNQAIRKLGLSGRYSVSSDSFTGLSSDDIESVSTYAKKLYKEAHRQTKDITEIVQKINIIEALGGDATELKDKLQSSVPIFELVIGKDDISERYNRTFFDANGEPKVENESVKFDGNSYYRLTKRVPLKGKSFTLKALIKIDEIKKKNYLFGDGGRTKNKALHIGFRDENTFTVDFFSNGMNMEAKQEVGKLYDIEFSFNADTNEGVLNVNGVEAKHTFDGALEDEVSYLGRGLTSNFTGVLYSLSID